MALILIRNVTSLHRYIIKSSNLYFFYFTFKNFPSNNFPEGEISFTL